MSTLDSSHNVSNMLTIHTDGGARGNPGPAATGVVVLSGAGELVHEFGRYLGTATNNVAEYSAVLDALNWVVVAYKDCPKLNFKLDSNLVVEQLNRHWKIKESHLQGLANQIWDIISAHHLTATFTYIPRALNAAADRQVNLVLDSQTNH